MEARSSLLVINILIPEITIIKHFSLLLPFFLNFISGLRAKGGSEDSKGGGLGLRDEGC